MNSENSQEAHFPHKPLQKLPKPQSTPQGLGSMFAVFSWFCLTTRVSLVYLEHMKYEKRTVTL